MIRQAIFSSGTNSRPLREERYGAYENAHRGCVSRVLMSWQGSIWSPVEGRRL